MQSFNQQIFLSNHGQEHKSVDIVNFVFTLFNFWKEAWELTNNGYLGILIGRGVFIFYFILFLLLFFFLQQAYITLLIKQKIISVF